MFTKSKIGSSNFILEHAEEILNDILGIRTDINLVAKVNTEEEIVLSARLSETDQEDIESIYLKIFPDHAYFCVGKRKEKTSEIPESEWIDSLLNNGHKAAKSYDPVFKFTAARHDYLEEKIFPETLARRFLFDKIETADLIKNLVFKGYTEQEQIDVIKSIYDHAYVRQFLDLFYNPREIIKNILHKIPGELEEKTPAEALLRYYISDSKSSVAASFNDLLTKSIQKKDRKEIKSFFDIASQIYGNISLLINKMNEKDKERPMFQPKGTEILLDYMLYAIENLEKDELQLLRDQLIMVLDLFDIDHLIDNPKLENLVKKLQNLYKPEEKTYCLNESLKRSIKKVRLMSRVAQLTYDGGYFLNMSDEDEFITITQAKNLFSFSCPDDVLDRLNSEEIKDKLPIILTNALSIYDMNNKATSTTVDYRYPLYMMRNIIGNEYLPYISVEKAKNWIDINPILIHLFNEKNTDIPQIFDYFLKLLENGTIPTFHLSWFSSFVKSARENISDEQMNKMFAVLSSAVKEINKRSDFKSVCEDLFAACINTGKRGVSMLKFLSTHCGQIGLEAIDDKFSALIELDRKEKGKNYKDEEMQEYLRIDV